eukprot:gene33018-42716_t
MFTRNKKLVSAKKLMTEILIKPLIADGSGVQLVDLDQGASSRVVFSIGTVVPPVSVG